MLNHFNEKHVNVGFCCQFVVLIFVVLILSIFVFLKIIVVVKMLKIKLSDVNNCRFYLFFISALCCPKIVVFLKDENVE